MTIVTPNQQTMPSPDISNHGVPFCALLCVEGLETSDGRMLELGTTTWRDTPLPFMVQDTTAHGEGQTPAPAWAAGQIDEIYRDPTDASRIMGRGHLMPNADGQKALELMQHSFRGVSIDAYPSSPLPPDVQATAVDQAGEPIAVLVRYSDSVISRLTMVPTPALECCCAWLADEQPPQIAQDAHGAVKPTGEEPQMMIAPNPYEQLVASAGGPVNPPRSWFFTPEPDHYQPVEVVDGHLTGHAFMQGQCHIGYVGKCETAPPSTTNPPFKGFHRTVTRCEDGSEVACGWLSLDTKHNWDFDASYAETADYYDHTGTLVAKIRASNGKYGTWMSGAVVPGIDDRIAWLLQGPEVSGDWRRYVDPDTNTEHVRELNSMLAVPIPGFQGSRTRPELLVASGEIVAQHGSIVPCDCDDEGEPMTPEERAEFDQLKRAVGVLVASATPETLAKIQGDAFVRGIVEGTANSVQFGLDVAALAAAGDPALAAALTQKPTMGGPVGALTIDNTLTLDATAPDDAALRIEADALVASIEGADLVDLTVPLSASELARYVGRYDTAARALMAVDGLARRDGSVAIADEDDLLAAARQYGADPRAAAHIRQVAARMGHEALAAEVWPEKVALSKEPVSLAKYSADQLKEMVKKGQAMPPSTPGGTPSYPIADGEDLDKAIKAVGRGAGDHDAIRAHIVKNAKRLKMTDKIPDSWTPSGTKKPAAA